MMFYLCFFVIETFYIICLKKVDSLCFWKNPCLSNNFGKYLHNPRIGNECTTSEKWLGS